ncbi:probable LRR receptor-like serine/threonine-protein kinase At3g47570 [Rhodamnia argentea]|uniref:Probable LRR receptor-like serine/threonine-protein kinase At3g47570 n=1 Tax=Rhodamnia argentea TaxID=178133 RepID=A0ABM3HGF0_9MYRT|nr:probable LRR receptor-like serine/threonine-protein kinase At3g47570 [Rhodamnia argentea]
MSNGSLDEWLHPTASQFTERSKLSLLERVNIAIDIACALDYLHHHCEMSIVHCDIKPSNVLLDDEKIGHVGDFGLSRFIPEAMNKLLANQSSSIRLKGSFGYVAPEYGVGSAVSTHGDVYSFGVLILEMFTGKRPTDDMFEDGLDLHGFAKAALADRVGKAIDPVLLQEIDVSEKRQTVAPKGKNKSWCSIQECLASIVEIGVTSSSESPRERMDIGDALTKLQGVRKKLLEFLVIAYHVVFMAIALSGIGYGILPFTDDLNLEIENHKLFSCLTTVILLLWSVLASAEMGKDETDWLALLEFKAQIADPGGVLSSWNDTSHFCKWYGVTCGRRHRRVTVLNLQSKQLSGVLTPHIGNLSFLTEVYLQNNSFYSEIPPHFGRLFRLQKLFLNNNSFNGQIPSNLSHCSNLLVLNIGFNMLEEKLPTQLGSSSKLQRLILGVNSLTGNIPPSFGNLSSLRAFIPAENNLGGTIPETLGWLRNLNILALGGNKFVGTIPISIFNISTLTILDVTENQLEGSLPNDLGFTLPNLNEIGLSDNHLTGAIPRSITNVTNLGVIGIGLNNFNGKFPSFPKMRGLNWLNIGGNNLGCWRCSDLDFLCSLTNSTNLTMLGIADNAFGGPIPDCVGNLSITLSVIGLGDNHIFGTLPYGIGNLINLEFLGMGGNNISGNIPSKIGNLSKMKFMDLGRNNFSGQIPESIGNLRMLIELYLDGNNLGGSIPSFLGNCQNLLLLDLSNNDLSGVACMLSLLYFFRHGHNKKTSALSSFEDGLLHVSYHSVLKATAGFSSTNLLGMGSFGSVYRGFLGQTQSIVAIKILDLTRQGASKSFIAECGALRRIRHHNLVKVLTVCSGFDFNGNDFKALVYEFMSNGSLDEWLHPTASQCIARSKLSLLERVNIAIDVACALDYLHHHCEMLIVHCDLKPSNVLLDDEKTGHVGDFGLARFFPKATHKLLADQSSSIGVKGSFGYLAPEYSGGSAISTKGDVYSFGVLILEMFTGKRPTDDMFESGLNLHCFAKAALEDQVEKAIDLVLLQEIEVLVKRQTVTLEGNNKCLCSIQECLVSIIEIGVTSSFESPRARMDISDALTKLQGIRKKLLEFIVIA